MKKVLISVLLFSMIFLSLVSASGNVVNIPDDVESFEDFKIRILQANQDEGFFATATSNYWGVCDRTCASIIFQGDCNPCTSGGVASMRTWHPDSMSVLDTWTSATSYCNDWLKPYNYYNQQAFCKVPTSECSGGADPGDRKCDGNDVLECSSSGVWEYEFDCDFDCSNGECQDEQCSSHADKKCSGDSVYWYDSCGDKQDEYERCESDEVCSGASCTRVCDDGFIGEKLCRGNEIVQQYQTGDCSTEIKVLETCDNGCDNAVCIVPQCSTCSDPTSWSQCSDKSMFRNNYKCSAETDYECVSFTETEACECGTSEQCNYDETCEDSICSVLECDEGSIADNHECIEKSTIPIQLIIWAVVGVVVFIFMIIIIFLMIKLKGGQNKNNGKNKKRI